MPPPVPVASDRLGSLWDFVRQRLSDPRRPRGVRHPIASMVCIATLAIAAGCQGTHAIAEFAQSLNHGQRRRLRCHPRRGTRRQFDVPCERTFIRLFKKIDPDELCQIFSAWMARLDPQPVDILHLDGKVLKNQVERKASASRPASDDFEERLFISLAWKKENY